MFSGCENNVGHRGYCFVYRIRATYCLHDFEEIKYEPVKRFKLAGELFEDVKLCYEFGKRLNFWCEPFEYKWRDISLGVIGGMHLKDCDCF